LLKIIPTQIADGEYQTYKASSLQIYLSTIIQNEQRDFLIGVSMIVCTDAGKLFHLKHMLKHFLYHIKAWFKVTVLSTLAICLYACSPAIEKSSLQQVLNNKVLKVGTRFGLTTYYNGVSGPEGFEYELTKGFADYLGVELEVQPYYSLTELFPQLEQQHLDLIAAGLSVTPQRQTRFRFGPVYQQASQKLIFKQGNPRPRKMTDLNGELLITSDSSHAETLQTLKMEQPELSWQETNDMDAEELLEQVIDGEINYTITDSNILSVMRLRHPELSIGFTVQQEQGIAWALNAQQDDTLLAALIEYFGHIQLNGQLSALKDKYFGHVRQFNYVDTRAFIKAARTKLPQYQPWFEQYADRLDWRLLAAMSYQESHWNPRAKSPTGVRGMMMLTLDTAKYLGIRSRLDPEQSIKGGAKYLNILEKRIPARISAPDRLWFALAAYNVGLGHVEDARILTEKQGANPDLWVDVKKRLPLLRQKKYYKGTKYGYARGDEAVKYVANIRGYYDTLSFFDQQQTQE